ncbi:MAG: glycosyltransferase family 4 protein, partial [Thermomicrobiales bacterium]
PLRDFGVARRLAAQLKALSPDLVCAHSSKAGMLARIASKMAGIPCVFTAHGWAFTDGIPQPKKSIFRALEVMTAPLVSRIICVSSYDRGIAERAGISSKRMVTIENGVPDVDLSLRAAPKQDGPIRIAMVARFAEPKDQQLLITAVQDLDHIELDFVGDGPNLEAAQTLVAKLGMTSRVRFLGSRKDVPEILANSHIFVLMSKFEGFPLSTLEAMRAGLPVLVSDVGGAGESIVDGESGFLIPAGNAATLRERILLLTEKPERRELMGNAARRRYESAFSADTMVRRTLNLYDDVVNGRRSTRPKYAQRSGGTVIRTTAERVP